MLVRYYFNDLINLAKRNKAKFRKRPKGRVWERLKEEDVPTRKGVLSLVKEKPIVITYGDYVYTITRDYIEIEIPELEEIENPYSYAGFRLGAFLATLGFIDDLKKFFSRAKRQKIVGERIVDNFVEAITERIDRRIRDTDTLSIFPVYEVITYPHLKRILLFIYFRPRISERTVVKRMAEILGISEGEVREHLARAFAKNYISRVIYESYPKNYWDLLVVKVVSENEGKFSFTDLRRELTKYGLSYREAFDKIFEAMEKGWIEERRGKYFTTSLGKAKLVKLPKPKVREGLILTAEGREFIF